MQCLSEIWSTNITSDDDYALIIEHNIKPSLKGVVCIGSGIC